MRLISFGTILAGARPFTFNQNVSSTFRGEVLCDDGSIASAFIKDLPVKELFNELASSVIGLALGLPLPKPLLAVASPEVLTAKHIPYGAEGAHLVFASSAADAKPVLQLISESGAGQEIVDRLSEWHDLGGMYGFDSWVANVDRHPGNLLLGGDDEIWMIDHGYSFSGPDWLPSTLRPDAAFRNRLGEWLTPRLSGARRGQAAAEVASFVEDAGRTDVEALLKSNFLDEILSEEFRPVAEFLRQRVNFIEPLSKQALDLLI
ncbi:MAG: HipA family kinase [Erythrobacter sp.]